MGELDPRIRIRAPLRCDGIGRLDCAEDTVSGDRLAVRWLPLEANGDAAVKACEQLPAHHALPRILQTGQVGTSAFVALDFPQGELLSARGEERLDHETWLKLASNLCDALATVHAQGVVHGEMSRDSVLVADDGTASLWDMPLVIANRLSDRRGENRLMQNLVKTAPYLAPERARGEGATQAGDVYALGAILCISGGAPLPPAGTTLGSVHLVAAGEWRPRVPSALPEHLAQLLARMVAFEASQRPTAAEAAKAFGAAPAANTLPTVPELQAVRLPPEILAAADALMKQQVEAMRAPTREMPLAQVQAVLEQERPQAAAPAEPTPALPLATDALPELSLASPLTVQAHTLDAVSEPEPEVVRIPTLEMRAVDAEVQAALLAPAPEVKAEAPVQATVPLNDAIAVAPDLLAAGAVALSADEVAAIRTDTRRLAVLLAVLGGSVLALLTVAIVVAVRTPDAPRAAPASKPAAVEVKPLKPAAAPLEELTPLPRLAPKPAAPRAAAPRAEAAPAPAAPEPSPAAVAEPAPAAPATAEAARPAAAHDFEFLDTSAEPPRDELKRPTSEL